MGNLIKAIYKGASGQDAPLAVTGYAETVGAGLPGFMTAMIGASGRGRPIYRGTGWSAEHVQTKKATPGVGRGCVA